MSKILHVVKTADQHFQIRRTDSAGEGPGIGDHLEIKDQNELKKVLETEGVPDQKINDTIRTLGEDDNAEIRF